MGASNRRRAGGRSRAIDLCGTRILPVFVMAAAMLAQVAIGQNAKPERFEYEEAVMVSEFRIVVYAPNAQIAERAATDAFARAHVLDSLLSDWTSDSEVSRLSLVSGADTCVAISEDLLYVLLHAQRIACASSGSFDVTIGPLTRLWRWAMRRGELPPDDRMRAAGDAVGYQKLVVDERARCVRLSVPNMKLDLGGIAKGFAADEMLKTLKSHGLPMALVDAGGDIVAGEAPPGEVGWRVRASAVDAEGGLTSEDLWLSEAAIASSGDRFRYMEVDGTRYSHIVDPRTGQGLTVRRLVTVIAPSGIEADALASAISVMGDEGLRLADKPTYGARLIEFADGLATWRDVSELKRSPTVEAAASTRRE